MYKMDREWKGSNRTHVATKIANTQVLQHEAQRASFLGRVLTTALPNADVQESEKVIS